MSRLFRVSFRRAEINSQGYWDGHHAKPASPAIMPLSTAGRWWILRSTRRHQVTGARSAAMIKCMKAAQGHSLHLARSCQPIRGSVLRFLVRCTAAATNCGPALSTQGPCIGCWHVDTHRAHQRQAYATVACQQLQKSKAPGIATAKLQFLVDTTHTYRGRKCHEAQQLEFSFSLFAEAIPGR